MSRRVFAIATSVFAALALSTGLATAASSAPVVHSVKPCASSEYKPKELAVSCADHRIVFTASEWTRWNGTEARAEGELSYPTCAPNVSYAACNKTSSDPATARLYRPRLCPKVHRRYFTRILVLDPQASIHDLRRIKISEPCPV